MYVESDHGTRSCKKILHNTLCFEGSEAIIRNETIWKFCTSYTLIYWNLCTYLAEDELSVFSRLLFAETSFISSVKKYSVLGDFQLVTSFYTASNETPAMCNLIFREGLLPGKTPLRKLRHIVASSSFYGKNRSRFDVVMVGNEENIVSNDSMMKSAHFRVVLRSALFHENSKPYQRCVRNWKFSTKTYRRPWKNWFTKNVVRSTTFCSIMKFCKVKSCKLTKLTKCYDVSAFGDINPLGGGGLFWSGREFGLVPATSIRGKIQLAWRNTMIPKMDSQDSRSVSHSSVYDSSIGWENEPFYVNRVYNDGLDETGYDESEAQHEECTNWLAGEGIEITNRSLWHLEVSTEELVWNHNVLHLIYFLTIEENLWLCRFDA